MSLRIHQSVVQVFATAALLAAPLFGDSFAQAPLREQLEVSWQSSAIDYRGMYSRAFSVYCPAGGVTRGPVWGSGMYTDDSAICWAAVHALTSFDAERGGSVYFAMEPGQEGYEADSRRGVTTNPFNFWGGSFRIVAGVPAKRANEITPNTAAEITWFTTAKNLRGNLDTRQTLLCPRNGELQTVWGSDTYNDDSSICTAAVHAGLITRASGGGITLKAEPAREGYQGTRRNAVTSLPWEKGEGSFSFPKGQTVAALPRSTDVVVPPLPAPRAGVAPFVPPPTAPVRNASGELIFDWRRSASDWRGQNGTLASVFCPAGGSAAIVWGADIYTDDSAICVAAVHALSTFSFDKGGTVYFEMLPGRETYPSLSRRGVTTSEWGAWESSFRIVRAAPGKRLAEITDATVTEISWSTTAQHLRGKSGTRVMVCPSDGLVQAVWGSDVYSDLSSICSAAVHAGIISRMTGGTVSVRMSNSRATFAGSMRAGVTTQALNNATQSFSFNK